LNQPILLIKILYRSCSWTIFFSVFVHKWKNFLFSLYGLVYSLIFSVLWFSISFDIQCSMV
jgi:hypothetical protein